LPRHECRSAVRWRDKGETKGGKEDPRDGGFLSARTLRESPDSGRKEKEKKGLGGGAIAGRAERGKKRKNFSVQNKLGQCPCGERKPGGVEGSEDRGAERKPIWMPMKEHSSLEKFHNGEPEEGDLRRKAKGGVTKGKRKKKQKKPTLGGVLTPKGVRRFL